MAEQPAVNRQVLGSNPSQGAGISQASLRINDYVEALQIDWESRMNRRGFIRGTALAAGAWIFGRTQSAVASSPKRIIRVSKFPIGANQKFGAANGAPAFLFRTKTGVFAYSAICTHQGCTVDYFKAGKKLVCPCHGASFDPFSAGKVVSGEAKSPLAKINVSIQSGWVVQS